MYSLNSNTTVPICRCWSRKILIIVIALVFSILVILGVLGTGSNCNCYRLKYAYFDNDKLQDICVKHYQSRKRDPMKDYLAKKCIVDGDFLHTWSQAYGLHDDDDTFESTPIDEEICSQFTTAKCYMYNFFSGFLPFVVLIGFVLSLFYYFLYTEYILFHDKSN